MLSRTFSSLLLNSQHILRGFFPIFFFLTFIYTFFSVLFVENGAQKYPIALNKKYFQGSIKTISELSEYICRMLF